MQPMNVRVGAGTSYIGQKDNDHDFRMSLDMPRVGEVVCRQYEVLEDGQSCS